MRPCALCAAWPAQTWTAAEALPTSCIRTPVLTPAASIDNARAGAPTSPPATVPPDAPAIDLHASGDSDLGIDSEPPRVADTGGVASVPSRGPVGSISGRDTGGQEVPYTSGVPGLATSAGPAQSGTAGCSSAGGAADILASVEGVSNAGGVPVLPSPIGTAEVTYAGGVPALAARPSAAPASIGGGTYAGGVPGLAAPLGAGEGSYAGGVPTLTPCPRPILATDREGLYAGGVAGPSTQVGRGEFAYASGVPALAGSYQSDPRVAALAGIRETAHARGVLGLQPQPRNASVTPGVRPECTRPLWPAESLLGLVRQQQPLPGPPLLRPSHEQAAPQSDWEGLPDDVSLASIFPGTAKRTMAAETPSSGDPSSEPPRKKKKKLKKRGKDTKRKAKPSKKGGKKPKKGKRSTQQAPVQAVSNDDLARLITIIASRPAWAAPQPGAGAGSALTARLPAVPPGPPPASPPAPLQRQPPVQASAPQAWPPAPPRAPAALGAPPGEETFPMQTPAPSLPLPAGASDTASSGGSAWTSITGRTPMHSDTTSVVSSASTREQEGPPRLRQLGEEAEALLLRYLPEFYSVKEDEPQPKAHPSLLFRTGEEAVGGIPLTPDFKKEFERISKEFPPKGKAPLLRRAFTFREEDSAKYLDPEKLSPEVVALGEHLGTHNPLKRSSYRNQDKLWESMSMYCRSEMRFSAYAGALANLAMQADQLRMTAEDRSLLLSLQLSIAELGWKQATRAALFTTRRRRALALSTLGFSEQQQLQLTRDMPYEGPFLFSGQFASRIKEELAVRQQARELAGQLRKSRPAGPRTAGRSRGFARPTAVPPRPAPTPPAPQRGRGARGHRTRKGKRGGQRGHPPAGGSRGSF